MTQVSPTPAPNGDAPPAIDEISIVEIANVILRHRRLLVLLPLFVAIGMGSRTMMQDVSYRASASFMPQAPERSGGTGAAALARQFGLSTGSARPGQSPEFYADLIRGREVLRQAVESEYRIPAESGPRRATLIEYYGTAGVEEAPSPWRAAVDRLRGNVSAAVGRETGVVELTVTAAHPDLAEQIAARLVELLNQFNLETRQSQALEEGRFVSARMAEAQEELRKAEEALKTFLQQNRQFRNSPELVFEHDRLQRQVAMQQEIYTSLAQSYEQSRIDAVRDTPVITVIASPEGSAEPEGRGIRIRAILGLMLGFMIAIFLAFILEFARRTREEDRDEYREFNRLKQEAWNDLRHPTRLIRRRREPAGAAPD